jgi:hypothetical protein
MLILLSVVNEGIGACFVGAFQDNKVSEILELSKDVRPIGISIRISSEKPEKLDRIDAKELVHYEKHIIQTYMRIFDLYNFKIEFEKHLIVGKDT